jgi:hypothetical protein
VSPKDCFDDMECLVANLILSLCANVCCEGIEIHFQRNNGRSYRLSQGPEGINANLNDGTWKDRSIIPRALSNLNIEYNSVPIHGKILSHSKRPSEV